MKEEKAKTIPVVYSRIGMESLLYLDYTKYWLTIMPLKEPAVWPSV